jgi:nucleotide-binding universal stress UspA family protein
MFKHILLPFDGSALTWGAVDTGLALAARLGASVQALYVIEPYFGTVVDLPEKLYDAEMDVYAMGILDDFAQRAKMAGVPYTGNFVRREHPYRAIVDTATKQGCDLIVMAPRSRNGFERLLLGSQTHQVILHSQVPVLVCHPPAVTASMAQVA